MFKIFCAGVLGLIVTLCVEAQRYDLISADQARALIVGTWENHPDEQDSFPGDGYSCANNPITVKDSGTELSIAANGRERITSVDLTDPFEIKMDLYPIFGTSGSYSVLMASSSLAFLTLPDGASVTDDVTLFDGDSEPEVTTRQRVVRLIRCGDPKRVS